MKIKASDLIVLDRLIVAMTGISQVDNDVISDDQVKAFAAGREMVREAFYSTIIGINKPLDPGDTSKSKEAPIDKSKNTKKSLPRLVNGLRDTKLAVPIWIALAQTSQGAVDEMGSAPIKAMSLMQDSVSLFIRFPRFFG
jgi:THO complex subunit 2